MFGKAGGNFSPEGRALLEALPSLDMGQFIGNSFSCGWDFAAFLPHMDSLVCKEG